MAGSGRDGQNSREVKVLRRPALAGALAAILGLVVGLAAVAAVLWLADRNLAESFSTILDGAVGSSGNTWSSAALGSVLLLGTISASRPPLRPPMAARGIASTTSGNQFRVSRSAGGLGVLGLDGQILAGLLTAAVVAVHLGENLGPATVPVALISAALAGRLAELVVWWGARGDDASAAALALLVNLLATGALVVATSPREALGPTAAGRARAIPEEVRLPTLGGSRGPSVIVACLIIALLSWSFGRLRARKHLRSTGSDPIISARRGGAAAPRSAWAGAVSGAAGAVLVLGWVERLGPYVLANLGLGYLSLAIVALAGGSLALRVPLALMIGGFANGSLSSGGDGVTPIGTALILVGVAVLAARLVEREPGRGSLAGVARTNRPRSAGLDERADQRRPGPQDRKRRRHRRRDIRRMTSLQRSLELDPELALTWDEKDELESINAGRWRDPSPPRVADGRTAVAAGVRDEEDA